MLRFPAAQPPAMPPVLRSPRLELRPLCAEDAPDVYAYASNEQVSRHVLWDTHRSLDDSVAFVRLVLDRYARGEPYDWGIVHAGALVGTVGLFDVRNELERAELGYALAQDRWGRGLMREAVATLLDHAFGTLGLRRVIARTHPENLSSQRLLEGLGFCREGTLRDDIYAKGEWWTTAFYGLLVGEFRGLRPTERPAGKRPRAPSAAPRRRRSPSR